MDHLPYADVLRLTARILEAEPCKTIRQCGAHHPAVRQITDLNAAVEPVRRLLGLPS